MEKIVEKICDKTKAKIGISRGVRFRTSLSDNIILVIQRKATKIVKIKTTHILLNSKSSNVVG